jgi:hypothetical protein
MRITGIVHPVLLGEEGAKPGADCQEMMPIFRTPRQPTHLQAQHQTAMVPGHLGEEPLEAMPMLRRCPTVALLLINKAHAGGGPAQGDRLVAQGLLTGGRFAVFQPLLEGGLTDRDHRQFGHMHGKALRAPSTHDQGPLAWGSRRKTARSRARAGRCLNRLPAAPPAAGVGWSTAE